MLTFNGNDLSSLLIVQNIKRHLLPPIKLSTISIAGKHGSIPFKKQLQDHAVEVDVLIKGTSLQDIRNTARTLADLLYTDDAAPLIFSDEPDKYIMGSLYDSSEMADNALTSTTTLKFYCSDPFWYAVEDDVQSFTTVGTKSFIRKGTAPSLPRFEIKGSNGNGNISITYNGSTITFNGSLSATDTLVLDSNLLTAYVLKSDGTKVPVMDKLDNLDFPILNKGNVNITFAVSGGATVSQITMYCNSRWR